MTDRFDELVGEIEDPEERERLRRVHQLLLSVDPPPEVSSALQEPRRRPSRCDCCRAGGAPRSLCSRLRSRQPPSEPAGSRVRAATTSRPSG